MLRTPKRLKKEQHVSDLRTIAIDANALCNMARVHREFRDQKPSDMPGLGDGLLTNDITMDLQTVHHGTAEEFYNIVQKELKSVGSNSWLQENTHVLAMWSFVFL